MKNLFPRSVTGQLIAVAVLALVVSQIALLFILINERQSSIRRWWNNYILDRVASVTELLDATPDNLHHKVLNASDSSLLAFAITPEGPDAITGSDRKSTYFIELQRLLNKPADKLIVDINEPPTPGEVVAHWVQRWTSGERLIGEPWLEASVQLNNGKWLTLEVARSYRPPPLALLLIPAATMLLVFGSAMALVIRHITSPITRLASAAEALGRGEDVKPVKVTGPQEIREAIAAFNDMRERLSRFVLDRTKMLAAVGHDLRTPITSMRLRAEFIEDEPTRSRILSSLEEMQQMAEAALAFAREEATSEPTRMVDLNALVQTVCLDQSDMDRDVTYRENGRLLYRCRPNSLKRAVRNLVENAVIHGKSANVYLNGPPSEICITIEDEGPGIAEEDLAHVFRPFVRLDESRGQETGGIGLGLAIARSIVRGHGGDIEIGNRAEGGLRARIQLPEYG